MGDCACGAPPLPATAQVAAQQGEYLAGLLRGAGRYDLGASKPCRAGGRRLDELFCETEGDAVVARPFQFLNLGILAYVGDSKALAQVSLGDSTLKDTAGRAPSPSGGASTWRSRWRRCGTACSSRATGCGTASSGGTSRASSSPSPSLCIVLNLSWPHRAPVMFNNLNETLHVVRIIHHPKGNGPESSPSSRTATKCSPSVSGRWCGATSRFGRTRNRAAFGTRRFAASAMCDIVVRALHSSTSARISPASRGGRGPRRRRTWPTRTCPARLSRRMSIRKIISSQKLDDVWRQIIRGTQVLALPAAWWLHDRPRRAAKEPIIPLESKFRLELVARLRRQHAVGLQPIPRPGHILLRELSRNSARPQAARRVLGLEYGTFVVARARRGRHVVQARAHDDVVAVARDVRPSKPLVGDRPRRVDEIAEHGAQDVVRQRKLAPTKRPQTTAAYPAPRRRPRGA